ncbi:MAG: single-stranded-DNA-specific exonuclease RecJ [Gemmatimonadetes bacterium]|nr:single-stranded-DNA-specific exonuclease RecJ [Gemmatimonadota bacterium]
MNHLRRSPSASRLTPPEARWAEAEAPAPEVVARLARELHLPEALCAVLAVRGIEDGEVAKRFLRPLLDQLHDPALLADGEVAAERIASAVRRGESILVHGDYDVDGMCATALYARFLRAHGGRVVPFVPHRMRDGYDFGEAGLRVARESDATLIVTADCGTVAHDPVAAARREGIDVVVTDHHTVATGLPEATALVNPQRPDCRYPEKGLCGTGLAYKVCTLVARHLAVDSAPLGELLDLVALATVADLVPLLGENRVLVRQGLKRFAATRVAGVRALLRVTGVDAANVNAGQLGFVVAPRLNAAGRLGESDDALQLLLTEDDQEADQLARQLDDINGVRQEEDRRTLAEALDLLEADYDPERDYGVVLAREGWHPGVIGIVASRVVERIHRPVVMVALSSDKGRGSARSIPGFHLYEALASCREHLDRFGGHRQAAGMDLDRPSLPAFRRAFQSEARRRLEGVDLRPELRVDLELPLDQVDLELIHWLEYMGPHGIGNPRPVFVARNVSLEGARTVKETHLKVALRDGGSMLDAIGFGVAERHPPETLRGGGYDVALKLERNEWKGIVRPQARLLDLRPSTGGGDAP